MMPSEPRSHGPGGSTLGRASTAIQEPPPLSPPAGTPQLSRALAEVKGQAQFLLYLADQIEDSLLQLNSEADSGHSAFLCKLLAMYSNQLETKHQGLGEKIAETCQEVYLAVREHELDLES